MKTFLDSLLSKISSESSTRQYGGHFFLTKYNIRTKRIMLSSGTPILIVMNTHLKISIWSKHSRLFMLTITSLLITFGKNCQENSQEHHDSFYFLTPLIVWSEIFSILKGSLKSYLCPAGYISYRMYLDDHQSIFQK